MVMIKKNKHYPVDKFNHTSTACVPCPPSPCPEPCEKVCGIFEFKGPISVFSFNTHHQFDVFFILGSERKLICIFGREDGEGCSPLVKHEDFLLCGKYEIEWCVCDDEEKPIFNTSPINPTYDHGCCGESYIAEAMGDEQPFDFKPFKEFIIWYPAGCEFTVKTSAGTIVLERQDFDGVYCSDEFCHTLEPIEIIPDDGNDPLLGCLENLKIQVKHK